MILSSLLIETLFVFVLFKRFLLQHMRWQERFRKVKEERPIKEENTGVRWFMDCAWSAKQKLCAPCNIYATSMPPLAQLVLWTTKHVSGVAVKLEEEVKCEEPAPKKRAVMTKCLGMLNLAVLRQVWGPMKSLNKTKHHSLEKHCWLLYLVSSIIDDMYLFLYLSFIYFPYWCILFISYIVLYRIYI